MIGLECCGKSMKLKTSIKYLHNSGGRLFFQCDVCGRIKDNEWR